MVGSLSVSANPDLVRRMPSPGRRTLRRRGQPGPRPDWWGMRARSINRARSAVMAALMIASLAGCTGSHPSAADPAASFHRAVQATLAAHSFKLLLTVPGAPNSAPRETIAYEAPDRFQTVSFGQKTAAVLPGQPQAPAVAVTTTDIYVGTTLYESQSDDPGRFTKRVVPADRVHGFLETIRSLLTAQTVLRSGTKYSLTGMSVPTGGTVVFSAGEVTVVDGVVRTIVLRAGSTPAALQLRLVEFNSVHVEVPPVAAVSGGD